MTFAVPSSALATESVYDFSDAAQAQFDAQEHIIINNTPDSFSIETPKTEKKKKRKKENIEQGSNIENPVYTGDSTSQSSQQQDNTQYYSSNSQSVFEAQDPRLKGQVIHIASGATFVAILQSSISSASLSKGDTIAAVLQDDWYYSNVLIAPQGSIIYGKAIDAEKARGGYGSGRLSIMFDELLTPKGDQLLLTSNVVEIEVDDKRWWKVAANVVGGALAGALAVLVLSSDDDKSKSAIIGASIGGVLGTVRAVTRKGEEVEIPAGTAINVRLTQPMNAMPYEDVL